jgi:hypothetical protein
MGLLSPSDWRARWIAAPSYDPKGPLPLFRRAFTLTRRPRRALLFLCGLGASEVRVNGLLADAALFEPGWTLYSRTCLYRAYDVTDKLWAGENVLGVLLGNGMYNVPGGRYVKFTGSFGPPELIAQLHMTYPDGRTQVVGSDSSWSTAPGPITFSCVYGGEDYDARREQAGWDRPGFSGTGWMPAAEVKGPGGKLTGTSQSAPPVLRMRTLKPVVRTQLRPGVWMYDLGQNCSLIPRISVKGPPGARVTINAGETFAKGGFAGGVSGITSFRYTLKGTGATETWSPRFTYVGARYLRVEGAEPADQGPAAGVPALTSVEGLFVCGSAERSGGFSCSSALFNGTARIIDWAARSNMVSILTDCPHREKLGWLEQTHLAGPSLMYGLELPTLMAKMAGDMADSQQPDGLVPDIAPEYVRFDGGFRDSPEWGSACVLVPWQLYQWYGDREVLRHAYPMMKRYVAYLGTKAQDDIVSHGLGDWFDVGPNPPGEAQLTPKSVTATAFYQLDAAITAKVAALLGRRQDAQELSRLASQIRESFNRAFYHPDTGQYATGSQCANAMALVLGMPEPAWRPRVLNNLVKDVRGRGNALTAGDVGYRYLLRALAEGGRSDVIFDMNSGSDHPGYGMMLARGNTTLTERWDGGPEASMNHFMLGHILEWFYGDVAGIQPDPAAPGFARAILRPTPVGNLTWASAHYDSLQGRYQTSWKRRGDRFSLQVTVPTNTSATLYLPAIGPASVTESGRPAAHAVGVRPLGRAKGVAVYRLESGTYHFQSRLP